MKVMAAVALGDGPGPGFKCYEEQIVVNTLRKMGPAKPSNNVILRPPIGVEDRL